MLLTFVLLALLCGLLVYIILRPSRHSSVPSVRPAHYLSTSFLRAVFTDTKLVLVALLNVKAIYGQVFRIWMGPKPVIVTSVAPDIAHILNDTQDFVRPLAERVTFHRLVPKSLLDLPFESHRIVRRQLRDNFNHSHLEAFHKYMQAALSETIDILHDLTKHPSSDSYSKSVDLAELLGTVTFRIINNVAFGADWDIEKRKAISTATDALLNGFMAEIFGYPLRRFLHPKKHADFFGVVRQRFLHAYENVVEERILEPKEKAENRPHDVLDAILNFHDIDKDSATNNLGVFAIAGGHAVNHAIIWALFELCQYPEIVYRVHDEIDSITKDYDKNTPMSFDDINKLEFVRKVWKETLRIHTPGSVFLRETTKNVTLKGTGILLEKGSHVAVFFQGAHTSESYWSEPLRFNPDRWGTFDRPGEGDLVPPGAYTPFSLGAANCAGQFFANYEGVLVLAELMRNFQFCLHCRPEDVVPTSSWVLVGRVSSKKDSCLDMNIPFGVKPR